VLFLVLLQRRRARPGGLRPWFSLFFASVSAASLCGGTVHGFFLDKQTLGAAVLWPLTLLATGVTALSAWALGARLLSSRLVLSAALLQQLGVGIHPVYFNHNALYHVFQAIALFLFFLGGQWLVGAARDQRGEARTEV